MTELNTPTDRQTIAGPPELSDGWKSFIKTLHARDPLPLVDPREWQGQPVPKREWLVPRMIPHRTVTLFSGDGGSGKTQLALQLIASSALQIPWLGKPVAPGHCLLYTAEDEADELHRRLAKTVENSGHQLSDLHGVTLIPMTGRDATLAAPSLRGQVGATGQFEKLKIVAEQCNPRLIVLDPSADIFGGDEINRLQVRQFIQKLSALSIDADCAVVLLSHPSLTGLNTGTGTSGSTAWSNSVRSRLYLEAVKGDPDCRTLRVMKSNYGRSGEAISLRWNDGVFAIDEGEDPVVVRLVNKSDDETFLLLLAMFNDQGQTLSVKTGTAYAPSKIAKHPKAKGTTKAALAASMQRLLDAGRIKVVTEGPPSKPRTRLVVVQ